MRRDLVAVLVFVPSIAAAQSIPPGKDLPAPAHFNPAPEVTLQDELLKPPPLAPRIIASWSEAMALMRDRSTDLRIAFDEIKRADGVVRSAVGAALLNISAQGTYTHNLVSDTLTYQEPGFIPGTKTPVSASLTTSYPQIDAFAGTIQATLPLVNVQTWHAIGTAQVSAEASQLSYEDLKRSVAMTAATALVGVVTAERVAELNRVGLKQAIERYQLAVRKRQIGGGIVLDSVRARRDVENAKSSLLIADDSLLRAREALGLALGFGGQVGVAPSVGLEDVEKSCQKLASIDARADIMSLRKKVEVAQKNVTDVYTQFLPTITALGALGYANYNEPGVVPNGSFSLEALLTVPLWDGGIRYGLLRQTRALADEASRQLEEARRQAQVQVDQADRGVALAQHQRDSAILARDLAAQTDELTKLGFETGRGTSLDLVLAAADLRQADINLALEEYGLVIARVDALLSRATCPW